MDMSSCVGRRGANEEDDHLMLLLGYGVTAASLASESEPQ